MTTITPPTHYVWTSDEEIAAINESIKQLKKSNAENPTGSALLVYIKTPKTVLISGEKQSLNPQNELCSELRTIQNAFSMIVPEAITGPRGHALLLVTASKDGSALPCQKCLETISERIFRNLPFMSVNEEGTVTGRTSIDKLYEKSKIII